MRSTWCRTWRCAASPAPTETDRLTGKTKSRSGREAAMNKTTRAAFISAYLGWVFDYYEVFLLTFLMLPLRQEFGLSVAEAGWLFSAQLLSLAVGGMLFGWLADRYGR